MKRFISAALCLILAFVMLYMPAFADLDPELLSQPYELTVEQIVTDESNPDKGVVLHCKIDRVPTDTEDSEGIYYYGVVFEQKVGENGKWENIGGYLASEAVEGFYQEAPGKYLYKFTWADDYDKISVSYRARMVIDDTDAFTEPIAFTPWSNIATVGIKASSWAAPEINKAMDYGLVPASISGDFTQPITREEFAELSVLLYNVYTGNQADPAADSTFTDCKNPEVLKAYKLGIVNGVGNGKFDPKALTNREQIAAMLNRAVKVIALDADLSTIGAPTFNDEKNIAPYFLENVKFMAQNGFIKGSNGAFSPKGTCTREMAALIAVRVYEFYKK